MKPLPTQFRKSGWDFQQIKRHEKAAAYRKTCGAVESFEVIRPVICKTTYDAAAAGWVPCDPREGYPSSEQWGDRGWTFTDEDGAMAKLAQLR